jgi:excisionase family DNA binding protein
MPTKDKEITTTEAAHQMGVRLDYLNMLLRSGKIEGRKHDGRWLVSADSVAAKLKARRESHNA